MGVNSDPEFYPQKPWPLIVYLIGSLRNPQIPAIRQAIEDSIPDCEVFCSWFAAGEIADDRWQEYEKGRGLSYVEALNDYAAQHVLSFDRYHLDRCDVAVLVYPAGRSAHTEMGYVLGQRKKAYILLDKEPERWDVMLGLATGVFMDLDRMIKVMEANR